MAARKLARYTTIAGTTYAPGDTPSKEHAELIDNPKVWEAEEVDGVEPADDEAPKKTSK